MGLVNIYFFFYFYSTISFNYLYSCQFDSDTDPDCGDDASDEKNCSKFKIEKLYKAVFKISYFILKLLVAVIL